MKIYTVLFIFGDINSKASLPYFLARTNIQNLVQIYYFTISFHIFSSIFFLQISCSQTYLINIQLCFFFHELSYMQFEANQSKLINYLDLHVLLFNTLDFGNWSDWRIFRIQNQLGSNSL